MIERHRQALRKYAAEHQLKRGTWVVITQDLVVVPVTGYEQGRAMKRRLRFEGRLGPVTLTQYGLVSHVSVAPHVRLSGGRKIAATAE